MIGTIKKLYHIYKLLKLATMNDIGIGDRMVHPYTKERLNCVTVHEVKLQARSELLQVLGVTNNL